MQSKNDYSINRGIKPVGLTIDRVRGVCTPLRCAVEAWGGAKSPYCCWRGVVAGVNSCGVAVGAASGGGLPTILLNQWVAD